MIASAPDFVHGISIPNRDNSAILESIDWYIAKYEPLFLSMLLGADLSALLLGNDAKWIALQAEVKPALLNYIYYKYRKFNGTNFNGTDETVGKYENSTAISPADKMRRVWNEMVDLNYNTVAFLSANFITYPVFFQSNMILFQKINELGL